MNIKYIKWPQNIPNDQKILQMAIICIQIFPSMAFKNVPKLVKFYESEPSGNPGLGPSFRHLSKSQFADSTSILRSGQQRLTQT
jgi:hypothetical protein